NDGLSRVAGVDEVGVAPTCGAVVAAAVIMRPGCHRIPGVRDSKTLSMAQREKLAPIIRSRAVAVGVGAASVREIDQLNIYDAIRALGLTPFHRRSFLALQRTLAGDQLAFDLLADPNASEEIVEILDREAIPVMADDAVLDMPDLLLLDAAIPG